MRHPRPSDLSLEVLCWLEQFGAFDEAMLAISAACPWEFEKVYHRAVIARRIKSTGWEVLIDSNGVNYDDKNGMCVNIDWREVMEVLRAYRD